MTLPERDVLVCRDCCCGTTAKHPRTDHDAQREALLACADDGGSGGGVRVRVVECLDECDRSNVVLVRDFSRGRRPTDTWLGGVLADGTTEELCAWISEGGPLPRALEPHRIRRTRGGRLA